MRRVSPQLLLFVPSENDRCARGDNRFRAKRERRRTQARYSVDGGAAVVFRARARHAHRGRLFWE